MVILNTFVELGGDNIDSVNKTYELNLSLLDRGKPIFIQDKWVFLEDFLEFLNKTTSGVTSFVKSGKYLAGHIKESRFL